MQKEDKKNRNEKHISKANETKEMMCTHLRLRVREKHRDREKNLNRSKIA